MLAHVKTISLALVINIVAGGIFAFAQDIVANSAANFRAATDPRYEVTGLVFDIDKAAPTAVAGITFQVAPRFGSAPATHVQVQTQKDGAWTECALVDDVLPAKLAACTFDSLSAEDVTDLNIVVK